MVVPTLTVARSTFVEAIRQPVVLVLLLVAALLHVLNTWITAFSMGYTQVPGEVTGNDKLLFDIGLSTVFVIGVLLAAFVATSAVSREIENKTVLTVVSKPVARPAIVIGKFLGVSGVIAICVYVMMLGLLISLRHGVLSTAAQDMDKPVIWFSLIAVGGSLSLGAILNYLHGWSFGQSSVLLLVPLTTLAWLGSMFVDRDWALQDPFANELFKPNIMLACVALAMALLVISAVAVAASTRLGQVMTIAICAGAMVLGLLSNHLVGRHAYSNTLIGEIARVEPLDPTDPEMRDTGAQLDVLLKLPPADDLDLGSRFFWGPNPNGAHLSTPRFAPIAPDVRLENTIFDASVPPAVVITEVENLRIRIKHIGGRPLNFRAPPAEGAFVFVTPTTVNPVPLTAWAAVPNFHYFWLVDAISQAQPIPLSHILLVLLYGSAQVGVFLSIAVLLFQTRDVG